MAVTVSAQARGTVWYQTHQNRTKRNRAETVKKNKSQGERRRRGEHGNVLPYSAAALRFREAMARKQRRKMIKPVPVEKREEEREEEKKGAE